jgi:predicted metal-dependent hydrolase
LYFIFFFSLNSFLFYLIGFYDFIVVYSHYPSNLKLTQNLIENWFKTQACEKFNQRLALCLNKFSKPEEFVPKSIIIRHLNKRWGSMTSTKRLVLNTKLIHTPLYCIDYVIIHELCHIQHPNHSPKFWNLLASIVPDWEQRKNKLEGA